MKKGFVTTFEGLFIFGNKLSVIFATLALVFVVSCSSDDDDLQQPSTTEENTSSTSSSSSASTVSITNTHTSGTAEGKTGNGANSEDLIENSTFNTGTVKIVYSGTSVIVDNPLSGSGVEVTSTDAGVTVSATIAGVEYQLSGTTTNGFFKIYSEKKFKLVLDGVTITNNDGPAINIQSGKRAFVVLNDGTINSLTDAATYANILSDEDAKGTFFSEGELIFSGLGTLNVAGKYGHAIVSDDYVRIIEGKIIVTEAVKDAIHTNDGYYGDGGTLVLTATSDGIEVEEGEIYINAGSYTIKAGSDCIAASYDTDTTISADVTINGGTFVLTSSEEGIESKNILTINGGDFTINTVDDGLNASTAIYINGGNLYLKSSAADAIDSNGTLTIIGGYIVAIGAGSPEGAFDCDQNTFKITGGTAIGIGGASSTPSNSSSQNVLVLGNYASANNLIHIRDSSNNEVLTFLVPSSYTSMVYTSAKINTGSTYTIYRGGSVANGTSFNGLYTSGTYSGGTSVGTFTVNSRVTTVGVTTNFGPRGGRG